MDLLDAIRVMLGGSSHRQPTPTRRRQQPTTRRPAAPQPQPAQLSRHQRNRELSQRARVIRAWATKKGLQVDKRGRLSPDLIARFNTEFPKNPWINL